MTASIGLEPRKPFKKHDFLHDPFVTALEWSRYRIAARLLELPLTERDKTPAYFRFRSGPASGLSDEITLKELYGYWPSREENYEKLLATLPMSSSGGVTTLLRRWYVRRTASSHLQRLRSMALSITPLHFLLQDHFLTFYASYPDYPVGDKYVAHLVSYLIPLSRLRDKFFQKPSRALLESYLTKARDFSAFVKLHSPTTEQAENERLLELETTIEVQLLLGSDL